MVLDRPRIVALLVSAITAFAAIAALVTMGVTRAFDEAVMAALRNPADLNDPLGPRWFEETASDITALGGYPILVIVVVGVLVALWITGRGKAALAVLLSVALGSLLSTGLKLLFARPRPDLVDHLDKTFTSSFPSAHAMVSTIVWFTLAALAARFVEDQNLRRLLLACAAIIVLLVGISRIYLGVHWPTDVVAGWASGLAWASICWLVVHHLGQTSASSTDLSQDRV